MREVLYRGKERHRGWVYGNLVVDRFETPDGSGNRDNGKTGFMTYIVFTWSDGNFRYNEVIPETVGQFTGLKDSAGKKIIEGDIVEDQFGNTGVITYSDHFLDWRIVFFKGRPDLLNKLGAHIFEWVYPKMYLKIIGNIHDNPEFLEKDKE
jgi:uncharacterized phage protein (TIGR01671 family)